MNIKLIDHTEAYVDLVLQSFEAQIRILHSLGHHSERSQHIENLRQMAVALLKIIDEDKKERLEGIEKIANACVNEFEAMHDTLAALAATSNDSSVRGSITQMDDAQNRVVHNVGKKEAEVNNTLIQRYNAMREKVELTLAQVDALKC